MLYVQIFWFFSEPKIIFVVEVKIWEWLNTKLFLLLLQGYSVQFFLSFFLFFLGSSYVALVSWNKSKVNRYQLFGLWWHNIVDQNLVNIG